MEDLLFLAHRIPFPPNKGDKIRSWHILEHLASRYRVHLGCFIDDERDWVHTEFLDGLCESTHFARLTPRWAQMRSLTAFFTNEALSVAYYRDRKMQNWVKATVQAHNPTAAFFYSSQTARFLPDLGPWGQRRMVMDFVDVDSDKWAQYAESKGGPMGQLYRREAHRLAAFEQQVAERVDASVFVSPREAELFRSRCSDDVASRVHALTNGVDHAHFDPTLPFTNPFPENQQSIVFTGAMDYWPNADAACWFADEVLPRVHAALPDAVFYVVGWNPTRDVRALADRLGIVVTGAVPEIRDYLAHASTVVAPLRVARGIQNKVLEAMAMEQSVIASTQAAEGLEKVQPSELAVTENANDMADAVLAALRGAPNVPDGKAARARVIESYSWNKNLQVLDRLLAG